MILIFDIDCISDVFMWIKFLKILFFNFFRMINFKRWFRLLFFVIWLEFHSIYKILFLFWKFFLCWKSKFRNFMINLIIFNIFLLMLIKHVLMHFFILDNFLFDLSNFLMIILNQINYTLKDDNYFFITLCCIIIISLLLIYLSFFRQLWCLCKQLHFL